MQTNESETMLDATNEIDFTLNFNDTTHQGTIFINSVKGAYLTYELHPKNAAIMDLLHVYCPKKYRGKGVASKLATYAFQIASRNHWSIRPTCSYISETFIPKLTMTAGGELYDIVM